MHRILRIVITMVLVILGLLLIIPSFLPVEKYQTKLLNQVSESLGRPVSLGEKINLKILPYPLIKLKGVRVASPPEVSNEPLLEVPKIEISLAVLPLLWGEVKLDQIQLEKPKIHLIELPQGQNNWTFNLPTDAHRNHGQEASGQNLTLDGQSQKDKALPLSVGKLKISDGQLAITNKGGTSTFNNINLKVYCKKPLGPFEIDLELQAFNQEITLKGEIGEWQNVIPINLDIKAFGSKVSLQGNYHQIDTQFSGKVQTKGNLQKFTKVNLPFELAKDYIFKADIAYNQARGITLNPLQFTLGKLAFEGQAAYDQKQKSSTLNLNLQPEGLSLKIEVKENHNAHLIAHINIGGKNLPTLLRRIGFKAKELPHFSSQNFAFKAMVDFVEGHIILDDLHLDAGGAKLSGKIKYDQEHGSKITYDLTSPSLSKILQLEKIKLKEDHPIKLSGTLSLDDQSKLNIKTAAHYLASALNVDGSLFLKDEVVIKDPLKIILQGPSLSKLLKAFDISSKALETFKLSTELKGSSKQLDLDLSEAFIKVGSQSIALKGNVGLALSSSKTRVTASFKMPKITVDPVLAALRQGNTNTNPSIPGKGHDKSSQGKTSRWSTETLDLSLLKNVDGDLTLHIGSLRKGDLIFRDVNLNAKTVNGIMEINQLQADLFGAPLSIKGRISAQDSQPITLVASLKGAQLENISPGNGQIKITKGNFSTNLDLSTQGKSEFQLVQNLKGTLSFSVSEGRISGFDLQKIINQFLDLRNPAGLLGLLENSFAGGETSFKDLSSKVAFKDGIGAIDKFQANIDGATIDISGQINLPRYLMDTLMNVQLHSKKELPPFKVKIHGPLDNPRKDIDARTLIQQAGQKLFSNLLKGGKDGSFRPEKLLKGLFGKGGEEEQSDSTPDDQGQPSNQPQGQTKKRKIEPQEAIGSILKGLF